MFTSSSYFGNTDDIEALPANVNKMAILWIKETLMPTYLGQVYLGEIKYYYDDINPTSITQRYPVLDGQDD